MTTLDQILAYLEGPADQLTPAQAAGVAGNLVVESNLNPGAYNPKENAHGLAQWEGGRYSGPNGLVAFAQRTGGDPASLATQLDFLTFELHGPQSGAYTALLQTSDPGSAAAVFDQTFERSSGAARAKRVANAQKIAAGQELGGSSTGSTGSTGTGSAGSTGSGSGSIAAGIGGWMDLGGTLFTIAVKGVGIAAAAGLVIVGAVHTVSD